ncbi:MAG: hypothetical protein JWQ63_4370 [Mucilaginibacter sp.]|nr:hypothetical protein [Mucilaginibacter sp.]
MDLKPLLSDSQSTKIETIIVRLQNSITTIRIVNWLNNFQQNEWDTALTVLDALMYYTNYQIIAEYEGGVKSIISQLPLDQKIFIHGYGDLGKSGSTMLYFFKQTPTYKSNPQKFVILEHVHKLQTQGLRDGGVLILLDDIIGSGKTLKTYFQHNIKHQLLKEKYSINVFVLCVAYMNESFTLLSSSIENITIIGSGYNKAFCSTGSVFGYRPKMLPIREFCFRYGMPLFWLYDREQKNDIPHPLGFNNSQALIIFSHSVPNNTLPIFWSNKNGWFPLYPRSGQGKISTAKDFKNENYYWLNLAYKMKILNKSNGNTFQYNARMDFGLMAVLRLKRQGSNTSKIFQTLGISVNELEEILSEGKKKNFFDVEDNITEKGNNAYDAISKNIKINNLQIQRKTVIFNEPKMYIPKHFKGMT